MARKSTKKEEAAQPEQKPAAAASSSLPLFYRKPAVIVKERHAEASVAMSSDLSFARDTNSLPLNAIEFFEASKHYPLVFTTGDHPTPVAVVGLEKTNYFIEKDGRWKANHYIPAYVRQYPFLFFQQPDSNKFFLCVDEESPHYRAESEKGAQPFYDAEGNPSELSKTALEFCTSFYRHHEITRLFGAQLKEHKLLKPYSSTVTLRNGRKINLADFQIIDEAAFNALPEKTFLEFREKGWLPLIYFAMASLSNWKYLATLAEDAA